jgi:aspartyl-tRNA(Asn)/glutamyl-tRNA(Gln) amidotransferase subunit A
MGEAFWAIVMHDSDLVGMRALMDKGLLQIPHLVDALKRQWTAEDFTEANKVRQATVNVLWRFMQKYDLLLSPVFSSPAFDLGVYGPSEINGKPIGHNDLPPLTSVFNWTGQPAASIPAGFTKAGLPVGLQIVGRHLDDAMVLRAAAAFEAARPWKHIWPRIVTQLA